MHGKLLWFNKAKDHGFIATEDDERLLVRGSSFAGGPDVAGHCNGLDVTFEVVESGGERSATNVQLVEVGDTRRARRRRSSL